MRGSTWFNDKQLDGLVRVAMIGGLITTISALTSIFLCLINNKSCTQKIYREILAVVGRDRLPVLLDFSLTV